MHIDLDTNLYTVNAYKHAQRMVTHSTHSNDLKLFCINISVLTLTSLLPLHSILTHCVVRFEFSSTILSQGL